MELLKKHTWKCVQYSLEADQNACKKQKFYGLISEHFAHHVLSSFIVNIYLSFFKSSESKTKSL